MKTIPSRVLRVETKNGQEAFFSLKDLGADDEIIGYEVITSQRTEDVEQEGA